MKKKKAESKKITIEFDEKHLGTITTAMEVYSRLRSGQIKFAMDAAFGDKGLTYQDGEVLESFVRTLVFHKEKMLMENRNCYYGVGCEEMKDGTVAWEIKKTIEHYLHYQRNGGCRKICDVTGDGPMQMSDVPVPRIVNWKPEKVFKIPARHQSSVHKAIEEKTFDKAWTIVDKVFKTDPLPRGKCSKIKQNEEGQYCVIVEEPYEI